MKSRCLGWRVVTTDRYGSEEVAEFATYREALVEWRDIVADAPGRHVQIEPITEDG